MTLPKLRILISGAAVQYLEDITTTKSLPSLVPYHVGQAPRTDHLL